MKLASYKGTRPGLRGLFNRAVRWWTHGPYSHAELIFSDGLAGSCTHDDGGVRLKRIDFDPAKWDIIECIGDEAAARHWFDVHEGEDFDFWGLFGFVLRRGLHQRNKWFCSEAIGAALGVAEPWRLDNQSLHILVQQRNKHGDTAASPPRN